MGVRGLVLRLWRRIAASRGGRRAAGPSAWRAAAPGNAADIGAWGEHCAGRFLKKCGFRILGERVRFGSHDELDLVAREGRVLVFVEVKTRGSEAFGRPASSVGRGKRRALSRAAVHYLRRKHYPRVHIRFDVVEVIGALGDPAPEIRHIRNAFPLDRNYRLPF
jgi:putative endonuclease